MSIKISYNETKKIGNNNSTPIGSQVDEQAKIIDEYERRFDKDIVEYRIDEKQKYYGKLYQK